MNLRDSILAATAAFRPQPFEAPQMGGTIYLRPISVRGMAQIQAAESAKAADRIAVIALVDCVCDENGVRVFTEADADYIKDLPGNVVAPIVEAITAAADASAKADPLGG